MTLSVNKVTAPTIATTVTNYVVGMPKALLTFTDFSVQVCASGGTSSSLTLTYTLTSNPAFILTYSAIPLTKDAAGALSLGVQTSDPTLTGNFIITVKASIPSGEYASVSLTVNIGTDCSASGITVSFGPTQPIPITRVNLTESPPTIVEGTRAFFNSNGSMLYMPIIPFYL